MRPGRRDGIEEVGDREYLRDSRYLFPHKPLGIPAAVETFMMMPDEGNDVGQLLNRLQDADAQ